MKSGSREILRYRPEPSSTGFVVDFVPRSDDCRRRQRFDVRRDIDDDGTIGGERLLECRRDILSLFDTDAERAHVLGDLGEVDLIVGPEFARAIVVRLIGIDTVEAALRLVAAAVVVDDGYGIEFPTYGRFDFADVIPEAGIAGEHDHRTIRTGRLGADPGAESPSEMAGAADIA